jgi:hypothetical protein
LPYQPTTRSPRRRSLRGHLVSDEHAPEGWTLADAEGNEVDVATMIGRD